MKNKFNRSCFNWLGVFLIISVIFGCSLLESGDDSVMMLKNDTTDPIVYSASDLEFSHRIDINPGFKLSPEQEYLLNPNDSRKLLTEDILGDYNSGDDIRIHLYKVKGDSANYNGSIELSQKDMVLRNYIVSIIPSAGSFGYSLKD